MARSTMQTRRTSIFPRTPSTLTRRLPSRPSSRIYRLQAPVHSTCVWRWTHPAQVAPSISSGRTSLSPATRNAHSPRHTLSSSMGGTRSQPISTTSTARRTTGTPITSSTLAQRDSRSNPMISMPMPRISQYPPALSSPASPPPSLPSSRTRQSPWTAPQHSTCAWRWTRLALVTPSTTSGRTSLSPGTSGAPSPRVTPSARKAITGSLPRYSTSTARRATGGLRTASTPAPRTSRSVARSTMQTRRTSIFPRTPSTLTRRLPSRPSSRIYRLQAPVHSTCVWRWTHPAQETPSISSGRTSLSPATRNAHSPRHTLSSRMGSTRSQPISTTSTARRTTGTPITSTTLAQRDSRSNPMISMPMPRISQYPPALSSPASPPPSLPSSRTRQSP